MEMVKPKHVYSIKCNKPNMMPGSGELAFQTGEDDQ